MANLREIIPAFFTGPDGQRLTPEQIAQRQSIAQSLIEQATDTSPDAGGWASVLTKGLQGYSAGRDRRLADRATRENAEESQRVIASLLGGAGGSSQPSAMSPSLSSTPSMQPSSYVPSGDQLRDGILETAAAIGADPVDLATAISYETGGTFDPLKRGPTTQWGQHRGLIQFGEPQARQYGVDWNDPLGSQLGANGAVANYFRSSGFKPGMSGLDLYSTINAGAPGRYGASDANNGGAPGDVRDKWTNQMGAHRAKALALLGDIGAANNGVEAVNAMVFSQPQQPVASSQPAPVQVAQSGGINPAIIQALSSPYVDGNTRNIAGMLLGQQLQQQQQANDPMRALQLEKAQLELEALRNPKPAAPPDAFQTLNLRAQAAGLQPGTPEYQQFMAGGGRSQEDSAAEQRIARMTENLMGTGDFVDPQEARNIAVGIVDGRLKADRHPVTGELQVVDMATGRPTYGGTAQQQPAPSPLTQPGLMSPNPQQFGEQYPNANAAFGVEGAARNAVNTVLDAAGIGAPYQDTQAAQADFGVLRESLLNDMATSYGRQPPSWLLKEIRDLTPAAGSVFQGAGGAQSQLNALGRHLNNELAITQRALQRQLSPTNRQEYEARQAGLEAAIGRVSGAIDAFGRGQNQNSSAPTDSNGIPAGVDPADWQFMTEEERALFK